MSNSKNLRRVCTICSQVLTDLGYTKDVIFYLGKGYGVISDLEREAIQLCARLEGILLDPVYTARAFGGLIDLIHQGIYTERDNLLFWHTGGTPALFHYGKEVCCGPKIKNEIQRCR